MVAIRTVAPLLTARRRAWLSPAAYVRLRAAQAGNIRSARFVPPKLGQKGWGRVLVEYVTPVLAHGR